MHFLLDTNILIPLEDSRLPLRPSLANFVRLARDHGHQLVYHPASKDDINRDSNAERRAQTLVRLTQYTCLEPVPNCPWNTPETSPNDAADNAILFALECDAAHALVTEDKEIHNKARSRGLGQRVYAIQTAEDLLRRLYETTPVQLPNIEDVHLHSLTPELQDNFFDSLRGDYTFDEWFRRKAREQRKAWVYRDETNKLGALCIYASQENESINDAGLVLEGASLKLCTFKVAQECRGRKIGELFLKAAFRYATDNHLEHIFIHGSSEKQSILFELLSDFGFEEAGYYRGDTVFLKKHPVSPPDVLSEAFEYFRKFYPHYRDNDSVKKFIVPIRPEYHRILFSDYHSQVDSLALFDSTHTASNAIKQAYLCHAQLKQMSPGDIVLFYRLKDECAITSLGVVERYEILKDVNQIISKVRRRTVFNMEQITEMASRPTKVMLFRFVKHFSHPPSFEWLIQNRVINGSIQSIQRIENDAFRRLISQAT